MPGVESRGAGEPWSFDSVLKGRGSHDLDQGGRLSSWSWGRLGTHGTSTGPRGNSHSPPLLLGHSCTAVLSNSPILHLGFQGNRAWVWG